MSQTKLFNFDFESIFGNPVEVVDDVILNKESHVRRFTIPKKDGSQRVILAPDSKLKFIEKMVYYIRNNQI